MEGVGCCCASLGSHTMRSMVVFSKKNSVPSVKYLQIEGETLLGETAPVRWHRISNIWTNVQMNYWVHRVHNNVISVYVLWSTYSHDFKSIVNGVKKKRKTTRRDFSINHSASVFSLSDEFIFLFRFFFFSFFHRGFCYYHSMETLPCTLISSAWRLLFSIALRQIKNTIVNGVHFPF